MIFNQEICCLCLKRKNPLHSILVKNNDTSYLIKLISFLPRLVRKYINFTTKYAYVILKIYNFRHEKIYWSMQ